MTNTLVPVRVSKISCNKYQELIYLPKMAVRVLKLKKGMDVAIYIDMEEKCLVIKPVNIKVE